MPLVERQDVGLCALLTLNRPAVLNAMDDAMLDQFEAHLDVIEGDDSRALVITGAGRAFSAGSDLNDSHADPEQRVVRMHALLERIQGFPKISVAAVNGLALGGGLEIALGCTFRVALASARLGLPEIKLGLMPVYGGTVLLPRLIGEGRALEMMLSGDPVDGQRALDIGLVNRLCAEPESLLAVARDLAESCARHSFVPQRALRRLVVEAAGLPLAAGLALERTMGGQVAASADAQEGIRAFVEKRKPVFRDC